jgi:NAD(P)-dependent dehydrogenase (short-subunit alcohol dehydrogenase family)
VDKLPEFGAQSELGRAGQPAELAGAYVYLATGESSYTTGSTLSVTGGSPTP